ncbi:MAG: DUF4124 domain-containing protein [Gammaproteobacteria bacterium]|nr:DUF4124 domain-containing protein [Gammaproteobacteria bacterium]
MPRTLLLFALILFTAAALSSTALASGKLYKWVDDKGEVHYGDKIPPEYAQQGHTELNQQGVTIKTTEGVKTGEQLAEEQRKQQAGADEKRRTDELAARDKVLLNTYASETDITQVRDRKLAVLGGEITMNTGYSESLKKHLEDIMQQAGTFEQRGKPVPEKLQKDIRESKAQYEKYITFIKTKQAEQDAIQRQAEADIQRFRELKTGP